MTKLLDCGELPGLMRIPHAGVEESSFLNEMLDKSHILRYISNMKVKAFLLMLVILLVGCDPILMESDKAIEAWSFSHPETFSSLGDIVGWTSANIKWELNILQYGYTIYWASPDQTYKSDAGDCKGDTILAMYFAHEIGIETQFAIIKLSSSNPTVYHALVYKDGKYYEPQVPHDGYANLSDYSSKVWAGYTVSLISLDNYPTVMRWALDHLSAKGIEVPDDRNFVSIP